MFERFLQRQAQVNLGEEMAATQIGESMLPEYKARWQDGGKLMFKLQRRFEEIDKNPVYQLFHKIAWSQAVVEASRKIPHINDIFYLHMHSNSMEYPDILERGLLINGDKQRNDNPLYMINPDSKTGKTEYEVGMVRGFLGNSYKLEIAVKPAVNHFVKVNLRKLPESIYGLEIYQGDLDYNGVPIIVNAAKVVDVRLMRKLRDSSTIFNSWGNRIKNGEVFGEKDYKKLSKKVGQIEFELKRYGEGRDMFLNEAAEVVSKLEAPEVKQDTSAPKPAEIVVGEMTSE